MYFFSWKLFHWLNLYIHIIYIIFIIFFIIFETLLYLLRLSLPLMISLYISLIIINIIISLTSVATSLHELVQRNTRLFSKSQCVLTENVPLLSQHDMDITTDYIHLYQWIISLFTISLHSWIWLTISCFLPVKMEKGCSSSSVSD